MDRLRDTRDLDATLYVLSPDVKCRPIGVNQFEVHRPLRSGAMTLNMSECGVLTAFLTPTTLSAIALEHRLNADVTAGLRRFILALERAGFLERVAVPPSPRGLRDVLCMDILGAESLDQLGFHLKQGRLIVIPNAFQEDFAKEVHASLDQWPQWQVYESYGQGFFHFHHHNIYDTSQAPPEFLECAAIFSHDSTKGFIADLTARDCSGRLQFGASRYFPGDHSLPHTDVTSVREVAYIWHLTKDWDPGWGGSLFWCPTGTYVAPTFNCLMLFVVSTDSWHFVTTVSPYARGKRMAINGWWTRPVPKPESRPTSPDEPSGPVLHGARPKETIPAGARKMLVL